MKINNTLYLFILNRFLLIKRNVVANNNLDLDDTQLYYTLKVKQCLGQVYNTVPGHVRKLEFKIKNI